MAKDCAPVAMPLGVKDLWEVFYRYYEREPADPGTHPPITRSWVIWYSIWTFYFGEDHWLQHGPTLEEFTNAPEELTNTRVRPSGEIPRTVRLPSRQALALRHLSQAEIPSAPVSYPATLKQEHDENSGVDSLTATRRVTDALASELPAKAMSTPTTGRVVDAVASVLPAKPLSQSTPIPGQIADAAAFELPATKQETNFNSDNLTAGSKLLKSMRLFPWPPIPASGSKPSAGLGLAEGVVTSVLPAVVQQVMSIKDKLTTKSNQLRSMMLSGPLGSRESGSVPSAGRADDAIASEIPPASSDSGSKKDSLARRSVTPESERHATKRMKRG